MEVEGILNPIKTNMHIGSFSEVVFDVCELIPFTCAHIDLLYTSVHIIINKSHGLNKLRMFLCRRLSKRSSGCIGLMNNGTQGCNMHAKAYVYIHTHIY